MTDEMTPEWLEAIKARAEAATPGPWSYSNIVDDEGNDAAVCCDDGGRFILRMIGPSDTQSDDVLFVAAARTDVPALVAEVERLRERVDVLGEIALDMEGAASKAEARATAAEAKLAEAGELLSRMDLTQAAHEVCIRPEDKIMQTREALILALAQAKARRCWPSRTWDHLAAFDRDAYTTEARDFLAAMEAAGVVPAPMEATQDMVYSGLAEGQAETLVDARATYAAMIAASPFRERAGGGGA